MELVHPALASARDRLHPVYPRACIEREDGIQAAHSFFTARRRAAFPVHSGFCGYHVRHHQFGTGDHQRATHLPARAYSNLGILPYLLSKIIVLGVLCLVQCAVLLLLMSLAAQFYAGIILPAMWEVYITLALTALAGQMLGLTISALVRNNDQAMSFIPLLLLPQVIFSGAIFPLKDIPLQTIGAVFSLRWSLASLGSTMNLTGNGDKIFGTCATCDTYQHNTHYLLITWLALVVSILVLGIVTAYFLKRKDVRG